MLKKFIPLIFAFMLVIFYQLALTVPYHFYQEAIEEGVYSSFIKLRKLKPQFYEGKDYDFIRMMGVASSEPKNWTSLLFNDFILPFPIKHPSFITSPIIEKEAGKYLFGYKVINYKKEEINSVRIRKEGRFTLDLYNHKVFHLPLFERRITANGISGVWKDIFKFNAFKSPYMRTPGFASFWDPTDIPLSDMVYELFIITMREKYFPLTLEGLYYWDKRELGVIQILDDESRSGKPRQFLQERIFFLIEDQIYSVELRTRLEDFAAETYRQKLLETISFKQGDKDSSVSIYAQFQNLDYREKLTPTGFVYLYSAFTHQRDSREFLRQTIQFLERGKNDRIFLDPLYNYGFEFFGTSFSKDLERLKESAEERLKRKLKEEEGLSRKKVLNSEFVEVRENFVNEEEKIQFYLKKAKEFGEEKEEEKFLIID